MQIFICLGAGFKEGNAAKNANDASQNPEFDPVAFAMKIDNVLARFDIETAQDSFTEHTRKAPSSAPEKPPLSAFPGNAHLKENDQ